MDERDDLGPLAAAWADGDRDAGQRLAATYAPLLRHIVRADRGELPALEREELEAEGTAIVLEYLRAGGDPQPARIAAVLRGRLRSRRVRPVRLTEGEEIVVRIAAGVRRELEVTGRPAGSLREAVERRCERWALDRCGDDPAAAERKLVQRGIRRALADFDGLVALLDVVHLDTPLPSGDGTVADTIADRSATDPGDAVTAAGPGPLAEALGLLEDPERRAVLWACGIDGDPGEGRAAIERHCGLPARSVHKLLARLEWSLRAPHQSWALGDPAVTAAVDHLDGPNAGPDAGGAATEVLALAAGRSRPGVSR